MLFTALSMNALAYMGRVHEAFAQEASTVKENPPLKCTAQKAKILQHMNTFDSRKDAHIAAYTQIKNTLRTKLSGWEHEGHNTEPLKSDLQQLDEKVITLSQDYVRFREQLELTHNTLCTQPDETHKAGLLKAQELLQRVHRDSTDIEKFLKGSVRNNLIALKKEIGESAPIESR